MAAQNHKTSGPRFHVFISKKLGDSCREGQPVGFWLMSIPSLPAFDIQAGHALKLAHIASDDGCPEGEGVAGDDKIPISDFISLALKVEADTGIVEREILLQRLRRKDLLQPCNRLHKPLCAGNLLGFGGTEFEFRKNHDGKHQFSRCHFLVQPCAESR